MKRLIVKADQEHATTDLQRSILKARSVHGTALEQSKVGGSNSNGGIERCIQRSNELVRTLRPDLESKTGEKLSFSNKVVPWLVRHAAMLITQFGVREGGRTAYQLMKGREPNMKSLPLAATVLFKIPKTQHKVGDWGTNDRQELGSDHHSVR